MSGSSDYERVNRLAKGPLRLPREITANARVLRLFMAYLERPATMSALEEAASNKALGGSRVNAHKVTATARELRAHVGIPRSHEALCQLIARAPDLRLVVSWTRAIGDETIIPENAIPSKELIKTCLDVYHHWVQVLSRTTAK